MCYLHLLSIGAEASDEEWFRLPQRFQELAKRCLQDKERSEYGVED